MPRNYLQRSKLEVKKYFLIAELLISLTVCLKNSSEVCILTIIFGLAFRVRPRVTRCHEMSRKWDLQSWKLNSLDHEINVYPPSPSKLMSRINSYSESHAGCSTSIALSTIVKSAVFGACLKLMLLHDASQRSSGSECVFQAIWPSTEKARRSNVLRR